MAVTQYVVLVLCVLLGLSCAFPQSSVAPEVNTTSVEEQTTGNNRQGRVVGLNAISQFVNPTNLAQFKSFFDGASALSSVLSFNLGNIVILSLIAGVALLAAPAILSLFGLGTFGALGRSLGLNGVDKNGEHPSMTINVYKAVDDFFRRYNIDAPNCMQRFACSAAKKSSSAQRQGKPSYVDSMLNYVLNSNYLISTLGHTKFMDAINFGKSEGACEIEYGKCPFSWEKVAQYLPFGSQSNAVPNPPMTKTQ